MLWKARTFHEGNRWLQTCIESMAKFKTTKKLRYFEFLLYVLHGNDNIVLKSYWVLYLKSIPPVVLYYWFTNLRWTSLKYHSRYLCIDACFVFLFPVPCYVMSRLIIRTPLGLTPRKRIHWCLSWRLILSGVEFIIHLQRFDKSGILLVLSCGWIHCLLLYR